MSLNIHNATDWSKQNIYWIGGSPCAGKSCIADILAKKYDFIIFKCDDFIFEHISKSDKVKHPIMNKIQKKCWNDLWMRSVDIQVNEEFDFYREEFDMLLNDLELSLRNKTVIVEGTALLPELLNNLKINKNKMVHIVPTKDFQVQYYSKRPWTSDILSECENPRLAFSNWMERDAKFSNIVFDNAIELGMQTFRVDGNYSIKDMVTKVEEHFGWIRG